MTMSEPKRGSKRAMRLPPRLVEYLADHREAQLAEQERRTQFTDQNLVVANRYGGPLHPDVVRHVLAKLRKAAGITWAVTPNELRTTAATNLSRLMPVEQARQVMGHKNELMMHKHYIKTPPVIEAGAALEDVYGDRG
jgi:integrase